jgi:ankyrin repeat protein
MACKYINIFPLEIFQHLIEKHGCDVTVQDNYNNTPLHYALDCFDANAGGDITVLPYLLSQKGINGNIKDKNGNTLLHWACEKINKLPIDVFKFLIETHGCDVNAQNNYKDTPIHYVFRHFDPNDDGHLIPVLVYLLSQKGVDVNIKDKDCYTILHLACICEIADDDDDDDEGLKDSVIEDIQNQKADANLCRIVEIIAERCIQHVLDETTP